MKNRVRELRERNGWSQIEFAAMLNVSRQTVSSIENGRYDPSLTLALAIAKTFASSVEDIFVVP